MVTLNLALQARGFISTLNRGKDQTCGMEVRSGYLSKQSAHGASDTSSSNAGVTSAKKCIVEPRKATGTFPCGTRPLESCPQSPIPPATTQRARESPSPLKSSLRACPSSSRAPDSRKRILPPRPSREPGSKGSSGTRATRGRASTASTRNAAWPVCGGWASP